jgi:hypothetical protein
MASCFAHAFFCVFVFFVAILLLEENLARRDKKSDESIQWAANRHPHRFDQIRG